MATIDGEDKEIKVAYGELSKMEPPRDVWFMMNPLNEGKLSAEDELKRLGIKYELSGNKYKPFKKIFKPTNKSDKFYKEFDDVIWRYNLSSAVESVNEVKIKKQIKEEIIRILSEEEMTDDEMEKKAEKEAKSKEAEKISDVKDDLAKQQKMLKKLKDVMKDRAKDYKKAEGKEKDNIKTELKALTSGKKQIEAKIKKLDKQL
jgi:hypothetical protein